MSRLVSVLKILFEDHSEWRLRRVRAGVHIMVRVLAPLIRLRVRLFPRRAVLFAGQAYYNAWYLSRALRKLGWKADVLNWDANPHNRTYYHDEDFSFDFAEPGHVWQQFGFYLKALWTYDVIHFSNAWGMAFGFPLQHLAAKVFDQGAEVRLIRRLGKKIVYSNNGCQDGVLQSSFAKWGPESVCAICRWRNEPAVCSDERNAAWGRFRNSLADYQCTLGGNRVDYNDDPRVHEVPEFYCLDEEFWRPDLPIPEKYRYAYPSGTILLYHAVGNYTSRTDEADVNIKSTHVYRPLVERLKREGYPVEMVFCTDVPNKEVRFYQAQADIVLDMLTFGWFGANAREAMMLGKPVICYLRPEWLESVKAEIPEYVAELPVISATPTTVYEVLVDLIRDESKRREIGRRGREFAVKWHSAKAGAKRFDRIYSELLGIKPNADNDCKRL